MISIISFNVHKHVRTLGKISESDKGHIRNLIRRNSDQRILKITFENVPESYDQQVRCEVQFDGNVDCTKMRTILKRACFMYMAFSDFHREVPLAIGGV